MKKRSIVSAILSAMALLASTFVFSGCEETDYTFYSSIDGVIYDFSTGEPVERASVVLSPSNKTIFTGNDGTFIFENIDPVQYTILVQKEGYYAERKIVTAVTGETTHVDITIKKI